MAELETNLTTALHCLELENSEWDELENNARQLDDVACVMINPRSPAGMESLHHWRACQESRAKFSGDGTEAAPQGNELGLGQGPVGSG